MKLVFGIGIVAIAIMILTNVPAPAADVSEGYSDFFCVGDSTKEVTLVRDTFVEYGDAATRAVADSLVREGKCEYIQGVGWRAEEEATECTLTESGHCIAVQKSYAEQPDGTYLAGHVLLGFNVGDAPKPTAIMSPYRTIILDLN